MIANGTWKLVDCPSNIKPIGCKWVYRIKYNANGEIDLWQKDFLKEKAWTMKKQFAPTA